MKIRKARRDELPVLSRLRTEQLIAEGSTPDADIYESIYEFLKRAFDENRLIEYITEDNGVIVATGAVLMYDYPPSFSNHSGREGYITNMYTKPEYRRRGIARALLEAAITDAKSCGAEVIRLRSSEQGRPLYEGFGFVYEDTWMKLPLCK